jgi:hypothetical protein
MTCTLVENLALEFLFAVDAVAEARLEMRHAVTNTQLECAATRFARLEGHRLSMLRELMEHCQQHNCATPEIESMLNETRQLSATAGAW